MTEIMLILILLVLLFIAFYVLRLVGGLSQVLWEYNRGTRKITEALWAQMGCSRDEWRERYNAARVAELEGRIREEREQRGEN
jgi:uncharacterized protein HemY